MSILDRQKVETILARRFPGATPLQIAAAANALMGLPAEWEEVWEQPEAGPEPAYAASPWNDGPDFRLFRRRES
jgi:hypothetical protein